MRINVVCHLSLKMAWWGIPIHGDYTCICNVLHNIFLQPICGVSGLLLGLAWMTTNFATIYPFFIDVNTYAPPIILLSPFMILIFLSPFHINGKGWLFSLGMLPLNIWHSIVIILSFMPSCPFFICDDPWSSFVWL